MTRAKRRPRGPTRRVPDALEETAGHDCRCECQRLLARISAQGVEVKRIRCKHVTLIPWSAQERTFGARS